MSKFRTVIVLSFFLLTSCINSDKIDVRTNKLYKIRITDNYFRNILTEYSHYNNFEGKGIILANVRQEKDSIKYVVLLVLEKDFLNFYLSRKQFLFYDTIGSRIVILDTKLESFFIPENIKTETDTILYKFLKEKSNGWDEIYEVEYARKDTIIKRRVIRDFMF